MDNYLKKLIAGGENQHLDFKYCISDSRKIARTLSAFANSDGGRLLIGVRDNGSIAGIKSDEEYYMVEIRLNDVIVTSKRPIDRKLNDIIVKLLDNYGDWGLKPFDK